MNIKETLNIIYDKYYIIKHWLETIVLLFGVLSLFWDFVGNFFYLMPILFSIYYSYFGFIVGFK
jgi:hypothetical protein